LLAQEALIVASNPQSGIVLTVSRASIFSAPIKNIHHVVRAALELSSRTQIKISKVLERRTP